MNIDNKSEKFWDMMSSKTDSIASKFSSTYESSIQQTINYLKKDDYILDYGCGTGIICNEVSKYAKQIYAIDISSKMIEIASKKTSERGITNITYDKKDIKNISYSEDIFDVIFAFNILHLIKDYDSVICTMNKLLKKNGYLITSTECAGENEKSILNKLVKVLIKLNLVPHMTFFTTNVLLEAIKKESFEIIETKSFYNHNQPNYFVVAQKK